MRENAAELVQGSLPGFPQGSGEEFSEEEVPDYYHIPIPFLRQILIFNQKPNGDWEDLQV